MPRVLGTCTSATTPRSPYGRAVRIYQKPAFSRHVKSHRRAPSSRPDRASRLCSKSTPTPCFRKRVLGGPIVAHGAEGTPDRAIQRDRRAILRQLPHGFSLRPARPNAGLPHSRKLLHRESFRHRRALFHARFSHEHRHELRRSTCQVSGAPSPVVVAIEEINGGDALPLGEARRIATLVFVYVYCSGVNADCEFSRFSTRPFERVGT